MPGKGNPIVKTRIPSSVLAIVNATIAHRNANTRKIAWTFSDFARIAMLEKVRKMDRCRGRKLEEAIAAELDGIRDGELEIAYVDGVLIKDTPDRTREITEEWEENCERFAQQPEVRIARCNGCFRMEEACVCLPNDCNCDPQ
jgi:hypothetical protein